MYSIILKDGNIINVAATEIDWCEKTRAIQFYDASDDIVGRINMDSIVGWIRSDHMMKSAESQESEEDEEEVTLPKHECIDCVYRTYRASDQPCYSCYLTKSRPHFVPKED